MERRLVAMLDGVREELDREDERGLRAKAQQILDELDPESEEGLWFEAFAETFASRFEAALVYAREVASRVPRGSDGVRS
jgi:hypothetical protein